MAPARGRLTTHLHRLQAELKRFVSGAIELPLWCCTRCESTDVVWISMVRSRSPLGFHNAVELQLGGAIRGLRQLTFQQ